eukprot:TRINITY_DN3288_c0_g1_i2.p1 TRINITY_DN3288_c0_g1~~TRINITY_DN3288_c0_g1_i2.p1  ORF type:complete len:384 (-),score=81.56 TRINITY_DN3288_c0_g1_i2:1341-2438(-)
MKRRSKAASSAVTKEAKKSDENRKSEVQKKKDTFDALNEEDFLLQDINVFLATKKKNSQEEVKNSIYNLDSLLDDAQDFKNQEEEYHKLSRLQEELECPEEPLKTPIGDEEEIKNQLDEISREMGTESAEYIKKVYEMNQEQFKRKYVVLFPEDKSMKMDAPLESLKFNPFFNGHERLLQGDMLNNFILLKPAVSKIMLKHLFEVVSFHTSELLVNQAVTSIQLILTGSSDPGYLTQVERELISNIENQRSLEKYVTEKHKLDEIEAQMLSEYEAKMEQEELEWEVEIERRLQALYESNQSVGANPLESKVEYKSSELKEPEDLKNMNEASITAGTTDPWQSTPEVMLSSPLEIDEVKKLTRKRS